jgi:hypothetical protein
MERLSSRTHHIRARTVLSIGWESVRLGFGKSGEGGCTGEVEAVEEDGEALEPNDTDYADTRGVLVGGGWMDGWMDG